MRRLLPSVFFLSLIVAIAAGCSHRGAHIPAANIPFAEADYQVLGNTNAEACGTYVFAIDFMHLFRDRSAVSAAPRIPFLGAALGPMGTREASRALYDALDKIPEASHLVAPRVHVARTGLGIGGILIFGRRCAVVDARGVVIAEEPLPKACELVQQ